MRQRHARNPLRGSVYFGLAAGLFLGSGGLLGGYYLSSSESPVSAAQAAKQSSRGASPEALEAALADFTAREVAVHVGGETARLPWSELGVAVDRAGLAAAAQRADPADVIGSLTARGALPVVVERERVVVALQALKERYDHAPQEARMDLENRIVHRSQNGSSVDVYGSLGVVVEAARSGAEELTLRTIDLPAVVTVETLGVEDISAVLGSFETKFSIADRYRNYNLKLAASKLNGYVLQPGADVSFNEAVGPRTEKEGYKVAGVIQAGEMVDGLAGGTCQISTTLHGAAFFAGLELVKSIPHSRPSTYVIMGLDATVVYPHVDMVLRNSFDFPVVIHYQVSLGKAKVEILGKERPYDKVEFERKVVEKLDFDTVTREDESMPVGSMLVDQYGFYGYKLERVRKMYKDGKVAKRDKWMLRYNPVTEYARIGINLDPNQAPPKQKVKKKRLREPNHKTYRVVQ